MRRKSSTARPAARRARILLVDDHPLVRERMAEIINQEPDLMVCGEAQDRAGALAAMAAHRPELAIIDLALKDSDGLELIKDIRLHWPNVLMLVVSMYEESLYAERVIRAGARGYVTKQEATRDILSAIRRVLSGRVYLNENVSARIIDRLADRSVPGAATPAEMLADRELQVFELLGRGLAVKEIARRLRIATKTVDTYRRRIREKLNLQTSSQLLQHAISWTRRR
ncbi:MAG TPA: response regulator transcription factor [Candidatus Paceibacterota bacterium]|jgi:DNA-binding NarL/FixJ family response regulator|nr:response regulator transcription factor [Verrucomicrobiota bacterium]HRY57746.1 response regulator transcription factor [Candidatus Paceibacterota bacterium]HNS69584.1 response regulator transcription factor [Verrucomicrobiota bacterium]HOS73760.1 response regulator transcription factor [Verrucomicrobiota bacterium]HOW79698.1 response regulator transcription factor [Verrucomicrobiota bacterium]